MPAGIGAPELIIVLLVFILLFGAKKLPDLGSSVGKSIKNFKKGINEGKEGDTTTTTAAAAPVAEPVETTVPPSTQTTRDAS